MLIYKAAARLLKQTSVLKLWLGLEREAEIKLQLNFKGLK